MEIEPRYKLSFVILAVNLQTVLEVLEGSIIGAVRLEQIEAKPSDPVIPRAPRQHETNGASVNPRRKHSNNGGSACFQLFSMLREGPEIWTTSAIIKGLRKRGFKGKSTGPSALCKAMRTGHAERIGDGLYRLTETGKSAPLQEIVKAVNAEKNRLVGP